MQNQILIIIDVILEWENVMWELYNSFFMIIFNKIE